LAHIPQALCSEIGTARSCNWNRALHCVWPCSDSRCGGPRICPAEGGPEHVRLRPDWNRPTDLRPGGAGIETTDISSHQRRYDQPTGKPPCGRLWPRCSLARMLGYRPSRSFPICAVENSRSACLLNVSAKQSWFVNALFFRNAPPLYNAVRDYQARAASSVFPVSVLRCACAVMEPCS
jgi:hypothetical protein